jgi:hypothetical protein
MTTILHADNTSIIINNKNPDDFKTIMNNTYQDLNNWFKQNLLSLNHKKCSSYILKKILTTFV